MSNLNDTRNMAVFCDFENLALGVREAKYDRFDMKKVLERLLVKGSIRLVTHLDVERADIDRFASAVREFFTAAAKAA